MGFFKNKNKLAKTQPVSLVALSNNRSTISEQFRTIRSNIKFAMVDKTLQTMVITSAGPSEGKSTVTNNLAIVFADAGIKTLVIDADMRRPSLSLTWNLPNLNGLSELLTDKLGDFHEYIQDTDVKNLSILTSGPNPPNPSELLQSERMKELIKVLSDHYDLIIFDTAPLVTVTDGQILSSICDGTILVMREEQTKKDQLLQAKHLLEMAKANILGVVSNAQVKASGAYYYYNTSGE